jgi:hypothetical protein
MIINVFATWIPPLLIALLEPQVLLILEADGQRVSVLLHCLCARWNAGSRGGPHLQFHQQDDK